MENKKKVLIVGAIAFVAVVILILIGISNSGGKDFAQTKRTGFEYAVRTMIMGAEKYVLLNPNATNLTLTKDVVTFGGKTSDIVIDNIVKSTDSSIAITIKGVAGSLFEGCTATNATISSIVVEGC